MVSYDQRGRVLSRPAVRRRSEVVSRPLDGGPLRKRPEQGAEVGAKARIGIRAPDARVGSAALERLSRVVEPSQRRRSIGR